MTTHSLRNSALARRPKQAITRFVDRRVALAGTDATQLRAELADLRAQVGAMRLLYDGSGRRASRLPSPPHVATLQTEVAALCGDPAAAERTVRAALRLLVAVEALGVGRVAGGTMNICGKLATISLLEAPNDEILEIGTLYGLFAAALIRMNERCGRTPSLSIVDPLVGAQVQHGAALATDPSGTPVTEAAVRTNLSLAGPAGAATRIEVGLSGDPAVRARLADRQYGVIVVDGDHGYDGIAADLQWVEQIAAPGGLVVLDDYGDRRWPDVERALADHLAAGSRLHLLGRVATSGYLRAG